MSLRQIRFGPLRAFDRGAVDARNTARQQQSVIIGPFTRLQPAVNAVHFADLDFALVDVSSRGANAYSIAEALSVRRVPFLLLSSYGAEAVLAGCSECKVISKPFSGIVLVRKMLEELDRA